MTGKAQTSPYAALIGDVIRSRDVTSQEDLFGALESILDWVNDRLPAIQHLQLSVGDEFQGLYPDLPSALLAALLVRLRATGELDVRFGIGWGDVGPLDTERAPVRQSGPAWWAAREAIEETRKTKMWPEGLRSSFASATEDPERRGLVNAFLLCRDQILSTMDRSDARITLGLLSGKSQTEIAAELGLSQPSVSARQRAKGPAALLQAQRSLGRVLEREIS